MLTTILKFFAPILSGLWSYFIIGLAGLVFGGTAIFYWDGLRYSIQLDNLKLQLAAKTNTDLSSSLAKLTGFIQKIDVSTNEYQSNISEINAQFAKLEKEFASEKIIPLPSDCKPDNVRVRELANAITAANSSN